MRIRPLTLAIAAAFALPADDGLAQAHTDRAKTLDEIVVTASPLRQRADDIARPVEVLAGAELDDQRAATLGETVSRLPGVQSSFFGPGVGRPIIRGLDGARIQVLNEGLGSLDVSTVSVDHAVTIEPFLADQIEVLKGPATLLFGPGAIGGAVNVVDGRIHEAPVEGVTGRAEVRGDTVADERAGMARLDAGNGTWAFHIDAFHRDTDDYEIPGAAERHDDHDDHGHGHGGGDDHDDEDEGVLENSATRTKGGAFGVSWTGARGFAGVAVSRYESLYGIPGGHGHEDEHEDDAGAGSGDEGEEDEVVTLDIRQTRVDFKSGLEQPFAGHDALRVRLAHNDYGHTEFEGDEIGTVFDNQAYEGRVELVHAPLAGWTGAYGVQFGRRDFEALGEEAFVPPSETSDLGLFLIEKRSWDAFNVELGGRYDRVRIDPAADLPSNRTSTFSASAAGEWRFADDWHLRLGLDRAQRAPVAEELYSDGAHVATQTVEIGDPDLDRETANQVELGLHYHGPVLELRLSVFDNRFDDFIYLADTGEEDEGLPVRLWTQGDASFRGAEAEAKITVADNATGRYRLRVMADTVRGELDDGGDLPRIAPGRFGGGLGWSLGSWRAGLSALRYRSQDRVAEFETQTDGYTLLEADVAYGFDLGRTQMEVFAQGRNLGDEEARLHTSFLKDRAPLPGRSFGLGLRAFF
jgi:iron complex outermembrane receptor protein